MTAIPAGPFCVRSSESRPRAGSTSGRAVWPTLEPARSSSTSDSNLTSAYWTLPPSLSVQVAGARGLAAFRDRQDELEPSSASSSRKSSSASSNTASSIASYAHDEAPSAPVHHESRKLWGEDPELAAARKALWEDDPAPSVSLPVAASSIEGDAGVAIDDADESTDEDDVDLGEGEPIDLPPIASPSQPSHSTLHPLPSCLRPPLLHKKRSASSYTSSHSSWSVRISEDPPEAAVTYSAYDYERRGEGPVEKLSLKEWVELKGVREAVGVWSGKIEKWIEPDECDSAAAHAYGNGSHGNGNGISRQNSCGSLAALVGVVTLGGSNHSSSSTTSSPMRSPPKTSFTL